MPPMLFALALAITGYASQLFGPGSVCEPFAVCPSSPRSIDRPPLFVRVLLATASDVVCASMAHEPFPVSVVPLRLWLPPLACSPK